METNAIATNLAAIEARIAAACARAGRRRDEVTLIAVTKTFPSSAVNAAVAAGITDAGENRVQEARDKIAAVVSSPRWHLIGHLQSNKAKDAVRLFDVIQSIDSLELGAKVARAAEAQGKKQQVMLQVNVGGESQKSGVRPDECLEAARVLAGIPSLDLRGLMTIPPAGTESEARAHFRTMRTLQTATALPELSMGMSHDFEAAIEEGATMVRIGRAIFGARD